CPTTNPFPVPHERNQSGDLLIGGMLSQIMYILGEVYYMEHPLQELSLDLPISLGHLENVEPDSLAEGAALSHCHDIPNLHIPEAGRQVHRHVLVPLLEVVVFADVVQVVPADDDGALHLHLGDHTGEDAAPDGDVAGEGALLVDVGTLDGLLGGLEAQADVLVVAGQLLLAGVTQQHPLLVLEDGGLLLITYSSFVPEKKYKTPSFYRIVPNEAHQSLGMIHMLQHFGWSWVGLFIVDDNSGTLFLQSLQFLFSKNGICSAFIERTPKQALLFKYGETLETVEKYNQHNMQGKVNVFIVYGETNKTNFCVQLLLSSWFRKEKKEGEKFCCYNCVPCLEGKISNQK
ncbi:hypothetical protein E2320_003537, partial [Naja naja]